MAFQPPPLCGRLMIKSVLLQFLFSSSERVYLFGLISSMIHMTTVLSDAGFEHGPHAESTFHKGNRIEKRSTRFL